MSKVIASGIILGVGIGSYLPRMSFLPNFIIDYVGLVLIVIGIILLINSK
ncbi:MAG: hypothetical protein V1824_01125 [archaeon]